MILPRNGLGREDSPSFEGASSEKDTVVEKATFGEKAPSFEKALSVEKEGSAAAPACEHDLSAFALLEPVGTGLRGTVYKARTSNGRLLAVKLFNRGVGLDFEALRRFLQGTEARILHPNLIPLEGLGRSDGRAFCAMPLLSGDPLSSILAELAGEAQIAPHLSPLGGAPLGGAPLIGKGRSRRAGFIRHAVALFAQVAEGLDRAHREGMVHGRLGPRNLIFAASGRLVVTDFGAERGRSGGRRIGTGVSHDLATLPYRSPEEVEALSEGIDARVDVYALGAILYHLLTGRPPFSARDPAELRDAICEGRLLPPSHVEPAISPEVEAVVERAMASDPLQRYPTAASLAFDLRRLLALELTDAGKSWLEMQAEPPAALSPDTAPPPERPIVESSIIDGRLRAIAESPPSDETLAETVFRELTPVEPITQQATAQETAPAEPPAAALEEPPATPARIPIVENERRTTAPLALSAAQALLEAAPAAEPHPILVTPSRTHARGRRFGLAAAAAILLSAGSAWAWLTLFLHDNGEAHRVRADVYTLGFGHLQQAVLDLWTDDVDSAGKEVARTVRLGIAGPSLEGIGRALEVRPDQVARDLLSQRPALRREAIAELLQRVEAGERPAADLSMLTMLISDGDAGVRRAAIGAIGRAGSSASLLAAFPIGFGLPRIEIDAPTFLAVVDALSHLCDARSEAVLRGWSFEDFVGLDEAVNELLDRELEGMEAEEESAALPPNLRVTLSRARSGDFGAAWIRARGRMGGGEIVALADRTAGGEAALVPYLDEVIDALGEVPGELPALEAARALAALAETCHVTYGPRIVAALGRLRARTSLCKMARSSLPGELRVLALSGAVGAAEESGDEAREEVAQTLLALLEHDPSADVRRAALSPEPALEGWPTDGALRAALLDPALRAQAFSILARRPAESALPLLLDLLRRGDGQTRLLAVPAIAATRDPRALTSLAVLLYHGNADLRSAALSAMRAIGAARALPLAAGVLDPRSPEAREMALEAACAPLEDGESPALRLLALREMLGLQGPADPPPGLREARRAHLREGAPGAVEVQSFVPPRAAQAGGSR